METVGRCHTHSCLTAFRRKEKMLNIYFHKKNVFFYKSGAKLFKGELTFKIWVCFFLTKMFQLLQKYYMQSFTAVAFSKLKL